MTKELLVKSVGNATGIENKTIEYILDATLDSIKNAVIAGDKVTVRSFGTFSRQFRKARVGRIINDNCAVEIPVHYVVRFKPSKEFSDSVATTGDAAIP